MKLGIMQSYFFPYFGYFQLVNSVDTFCLYEHVTFRKRSWITRNRILDKGNQEPRYINIPVKNKSSFKAIGEISIDDSTNWRRTILDALYFNYKKAPFFESSYDVLERLINLKIENLHDYNSEIVVNISRWLECSTSIVSKSEKAVETELENGLIDHTLDIKTNRVVKLCRLYGASHYVNPTGGVALYCKDSFTRNGLELSFLDSHIEEYEQWGESYTPHLSIIDMMMHLSREKMQHLLKSYSLS